MNEVILAVLIVLSLLLWRAYSSAIKKLDRLIEGTEEQNTKTDHSTDLTNRDYLAFIFRKICDIKETKSDMVCMDTKENTACDNFHEYIRRDNLAKIYAAHLTLRREIPKDLALIRARFEVAHFGQEAIINIVNSECHKGVRRQQDRKAQSDFFSSGILERDIERRLKEKMPPSKLFAPIYDLIVNQGYAGEKDFAATLTCDDYQTYEAIVERSAIISKLEHMGILSRQSGEHWGDILRFRLKTMDAHALRELIYGSGTQHDDEYFDEQFREKRFPRLFDAYHTGLVWGS